MSGDFNFDTALRELDKSETHLVIRMELRKWGKPMTVIQGLPKTGKSIDDIARKLKARLATGGTVKDGMVMLQGDHRNRIKDELVKLGFPADHVEVY